MSLKVKSVLLFMAIVSGLMLISFTSVYFMYADTRADEFYERLKDKCKTTYRLLIEMEEKDHNLLQAIDRNTINELYDEKVLIFDDHDKIIYSSIDDKRITYSPSLLERIRKREEIRTREGESEVYGVLIHEPDRDYVVLASSYDIYGHRKLENLMWILIITFSVALILTGILSFFFTQKILSPLEKLSWQVQRINENSLNERVEESRSRDELALLARNFNLMLDRIDRAFAVQKNFVQHASHELRTPIASMISQTESALSKELGPGEYKNLLNSLLDDQRELAELTNALLLLSKYEQLKFAANWPIVRLDENIYRSIDTVQALFPTCTIKFDFVRIPENEKQLAIRGHEALLQSAFRNFIKNSCQYSDDNAVNIELDFSDNEMIVMINNHGPTLSAEETQQLFTPFFRGENSASKKGFGLGLSICKRIIEMHNGKIMYSIPKPDVNCITVVLPRQF